MVASCSCCDGVTCICCSRLTRPTYSAWPIALRLPLSPSMRWLAGPLRTRLCKRRLRRMANIRR